MFRVSHKGEGIDDAETIDDAREIVRGQEPGRYDVDEIRADPFPSGHISRAWGVKAMSGYSCRLKRWIGVCELPPGASR
jgi:hypothetical protein